MSDFIYYSFVVVGLILLVKNGWDILKFAFKVWYYVFALIVVGFFVISYIVPAIGKFLFY